MPWSFPRPILADTPDQPVPSRADEPILPASVDPPGPVADNPAPVPPDPHVLLVEALISGDRYRIVAQLASNGLLLNPAAMALYLDEPGSPIG